MGQESQMRTEFLVMARRYGVAAPPDAVWQRYRSWCADENPALSLIDRTLLKATAKGALLAWPASAYAARFHRRSALRRREVALLAFLECDADAASCIDTSRARGAAKAWLCFFWWGSVEALGLLLGLPVFAFVHLLGGKS